MSDPPTWSIDRVLYKENVHRKICRNPRLLLKVNHCTLSYLTQEPHSSNPNPF